MNIIDPHIHLFALSSGDYHWLKANNPPLWPDKPFINKSFIEKDLSLTSGHTLKSFVHIEAGFDNKQPWRELAFLEKTCEIPFKAIANIDLTMKNEQFIQCLEKLSELTSFVGVRHILDEQATNLFDNKQTLVNFILLNDFAKKSKEGFVFETQFSLSNMALIYPMCDIIRGTPNLKLIINHAGFPDYDMKSLEWINWQKNLEILSNFSNVFIKCSGWEMTKRSYQLDWVNKNLTIIFKTFGKNRIMLASNFPLCLLSKISYQDYWELILTSAFFQSLNTQERNALCYDNALRLYSIAI